jgi:hypothetical protein
MPLLEQNDPVKTVATASFVANVLQTVPIMNLVGKSRRSDTPMAPLIDETGELAVGASEDREAERTLVIERTAMFEGTFPLYSNLMLRLTVL